MAELEGRLSDDTIGLKQARELFDLAVRLTENCHESFINGSLQSRRRGSRPMFAEIVVQDRHIVRHEYQEPFRLFLEGLSGRGGSNKDLSVVPTGCYSNLRDVLEQLAGSARSSRSSRM